MQVVITGAAGNLGTKLRQHLETQAWVEKIIGIDVVPFAPGPKTEAVVADLTQADDARWVPHVRAADGIVHYASANPAPTSSWAESALSFDMTANLLEQAGGDRPCRFVFASSNHAMGGYRDDDVPPGTIGMSTPQKSGTRYFDGQIYRWGAAYGATKMLGERVSIARARATHGRITAVATRIGWCQGGDNLPATLGPNGGGSRGETNPDEIARNWRWYRSMWLSNRDHAQLMEKALTASAGNWPGPAIVISGMSNNKDMPWNIAEAAEWIGYRPLDNVWDHLSH